MPGDSAGVLNHLTSLSQKILCSLARVLWFIVHYQLVITVGISLPNERQECSIQYFLDEELFLHDSFNLDEIPSSRPPEASPQHDPPTTMFISGDGGLWVLHLSLLSPNISNVSMAKELLFGLI